MRSKLHSAIHVYIGCLIDLQEDDMFAKVQIKKLFTNLKAIYRTHLGKDENLAKSFRFNFSKNC
jgi:hypothetical protein